MADACAPCCYDQLRAHALSGRTTCIGSACAAVAQLGALASTTTAVNAAVANGAVTAAAYAGGALTTDGATLARTTAGALEATSLTLNGVPATPDAAASSTTYVVPVGFAHNGIVVMTVGASQGSVYLPPSTAVPVGYTLSIYAIGTGVASILISSALQDQGIVGISQISDFGGNSFFLTKGQWVRMVWTGISWFAWQ